MMCCGVRVSGCVWVSQLFLLFNFFFVDHVHFIIREGHSNKPSGPAGVDVSGIAKNS